MKTEYSSGQSGLFYQNFFLNLTFIVYNYICFYRRNNSRQKLRYVLVKYQSIKNNLNKYKVFITTDVVVSEIKIKNEKYNYLFIKQL